MKYVSKSGLRGWLVLVLLVMVVATWGCAAQPEKKEPFFEKWRALAETSQAQSPPAPADRHPVFPGKRGPKTDGDGC